ncbi:serine-threonine/tyrosine-protein kinase catalytic domain-containing protein, partial [Tanacetum coccineum]
SDVYSFGIVLFEVLCGRLCIIEPDNGFILSGKSVKEYYNNGNLVMIIDPSLREHMGSYSMTKFSEIAYRCLHDDREQRPAMDIVAKELEETLNLQVALAHKLEENEEDASENWEKKLPHDYPHLIKMSDIPLNYTNREELYLLFCRGFLANNGQQWFSMCKSTCGICSLLPSTHVLYEHTSFKRLETLSIRESSNTINGGPGMSKYNYANSETSLVEKRDDGWLEASFLTNRIHVVFCCFIIARFWDSTPAFGATSSTAFGVASSSPFGGSSMFGQKPAFGGFDLTSGPFGSSFAQSQPASRSSPFGSSTFGAGSQPASVCQTPKEFENTILLKPYGNTGSPFGAQTTATAFGTSNFGQRAGSRAIRYARTPDSGSVTQPARKLESVSSMPAFKDKVTRNLDGRTIKQEIKGGQILLVSLLVEWDLMQTTHSQTLFLHLHSMHAMIYNKYM